MKFRYDGGVIEFVDFLDIKREGLKNKNDNNLFKNQFLLMEKRIILRLSVH